MTEVHMVSVSGGKDSTATLLLAVSEGFKPVAVFADTQHEHPLTYQYLEYLDREVCPISTVRADFARQMAGKRAYIAEHWAADGVPDERIRQALDVLHPTGNAFLDLCLWKGRFPSPRRRFCSEQLKHHPIRDQVVDPLLMDGHDVWSWQGVRAEESRSRALLPMFDRPEEGLTVFRPLIHWSAEQVFDLHRDHGVRWNPLYEQGMGRVGCMPCIMARKGELREIANRWPEVIDHLEWMEERVALASKRGSSTFYDTRVIEKGDTANIHYTTHGIRQIVEWTKTSRGGRQYDLVSSIEKDETICSSIYGLCETAA